MPRWARSSRAEAVLTAGSRALRPAWLHGVHPLRGFRLPGLFEEGSQRALRTPAACSRPDTNRKHHAAYTLASGEKGASVLSALARVLRASPSFFPPRNIPVHIHMQDRLG